MRAFIFIALMGLFSASAVASLDAVDQRHIDQLLESDPASVKLAAQGIYNTGKKSAEVLDVAAEVLLTGYSTATGGEVESLSWLCRAIGNSGNPRYSDALREVSEQAPDSQLRRYAGQALSQVGEGGEQYQRGGVNLAALRDGGAALPAAVPPGPGLDVIKVGMSVQEVYDLLGKPTATTTQQLSDSLVPFGKGGKDLARTHLLYKGKGRVICSQDAYSAVSRVQEVVIDPEETGYP